jgi:hypothetical protein
MTWLRSVDSILNSKGIDPHTPLQSEINRIRQEHCYLSTFGALRSSSDTGLDPAGTTMFYYQYGVQLSMEQGVVVEQ